MAKRETQRIMITMDKRLVVACDKYIEKVQEAGVSGITTKSQLIEQALLMYFDILAKQNAQLTKGEKKKHES